MLGNKPIQRVGALVVIFISIVLLVGITFITQLYRNALDSTRSWVSNVVSTEVKQIDDVFRLYLANQTDSAGTIDERSLEHLFSIFSKNSILGPTGDCVFYRRDSLNRTEILASRFIEKSTLDYIVNTPQPFPHDTTKVRAFLAKDYRGSEVIFAHSYLRNIDVYFMAKVDIDQIRTPFYRASIFSWIVSIMVIVIGLFLFYFAIKPLIVQLRIEEERYRQLFMTIKSGVVVFQACKNGREFIIKDVNQSAEKIEKIEKGNVIGKKVSEVIPGIINFGLLKVFQRVYQTGESEYHPVSFYEENRLKGWRENYIYRLPHNEIVSVFDDVTEQKKYEFALQASNESLEELVYITSHDLQVPLISMAGYATELLETYKDKLDNNGVYCLKRLQTNAERMHKLVLSLLDISRLNTVKYPVENIDPTELVNNVLKDLSLVMEKKGVKFKINIMPHIQGDKVRMQGVFQNLIINSLNYGAKIITVGYEKKAFFVKDDGIGIPGDQLEKIFRPGERLKKVNTEGVGMGLTFCKKVIERHNGKIWATSGGENKGATIYFTISGREPNAET
ncbi:hypothetical protein JW935_14835 [candidate division KSB1 bacterium]|nr:hypothetical protein [candidate division KSB1 bacterium]